MPPVAVATAAAAPFPQLYYAGFWLRFVAYLIDSVILAVGGCLLAVIFIFGTGFAGKLESLSNNPSPDDAVVAAVILAVLFLALGIIAAAWLYYALMESSASQGTPGKMALGLIVTDMQCQRVSFGRASGRFFAKLITGLIPFAIGYIMAGFTAKKQALHDMIASCLVLRKV